jgi:hypothetical protein
MFRLARGLSPSSHQRGWLARDIVAGIVLSTLLVPQGMAYAELAGLPSITGLYTSILCCSATQPSARRRHHRRCPAGPAPEELQAMGWVFAPADDDQQELDGRQMPVPETVESPAQG